MWDNSGTKKYFFKKVKGTPEGYFDVTNPPTSGELEGDYVYQYKDHLGNIRLSYSDTDGNGSITATTEILEENNYYPFGLKHKGYNNNVNSSNIALKRKFGGKEYQDELGLGWYDITARNYDPALGRWMNIDPLAEQMRRHSPYNYAFDNPIYFIDYDGLSPQGGMAFTDYYDDGNGNIIYAPNVNGPEDLPDGLDGATYIGPTYYDESTGTFWDENGNPHENVIFDFLKMDYKFSWSWWFKNLTGTTNIERIGSGFVITGKGSTTGSNNRSEHPEDDVYIPKEVITALTSMGKTKKKTKKEVDNTVLNWMKIFQNGQKNTKESIRIFTANSTIDGSINAEAIKVYQASYDVSNYPDVAIDSSDSYTTVVSGSKPEVKRKIDSIKAKNKSRRSTTEAYKNNN